MNGLMIRRFAAVALLVLSTVSDGQAQTKAEKGEWPQFLGPNRNGISTETGLLTEWPEGGPKVVLSLIHI